MNKILIVEGGSLLARLLEKTVEAMGYHVIDIISSSLDALAAVKCLQPHAVLMDISLRTAEDDMDIAKHIQDAHGVPVIFMSAHMDGKIKKRAIEVSNGRFLDKPFDDLELKRSLMLALHLKSGPNETHAVLAMPVAADS